MKTLQLNKKITITLACIFALVAFMSLINVVNINSARAADEQCVTYDNQAGGGGAHTAGQASTDSSGSIAGVPCETTVEVNVPEIISLDLTGGAKDSSGNSDTYAEIEAELGKTAESDTLKAHVETNSADGYKLMIKGTTPADSSHTDPDCKSGGAILCTETDGMESDDFTASTGGFTNDAKWGYRADNSQIGGNNPADAFSSLTNSDKFFKVTNSDTIIKGGDGSGSSGGESATTGAPTATGDSFIRFGATVSALTPSGKYVGQVTITAVPEV